MKVTLKQHPASNKEILTDEVEILVNGKIVQFWINERSGELGIWFEDGLVPIANGSNHLRVAPTDRTVMRCAGCGSHVATTVCATCKK